MKKTYLWIIIVFIVLLLIGGFFWLQGKKTNNTKNTPAAGEDYRSRIKSLQQVVADKLGRNLDTVYINIAKESSDYAKGIYVIDQKEPGVFLAKKENDVWHVLYLKNSTYTCQEVSDMKIPEDLVSDCLKK